MIDQLEGFSNRKRFIFDEFEWNFPIFSKSCPKSTYAGPRITLTKRSDLSFLEDFSLKNQYVILYDRPLRKVEQSMILSTNPALKQCIILYDQPPYRGEQSDGTESIESTVGHKR